ncbi:MAG: lysophospholipase [Leptospiraceae bacterium]|nr:lysophospholipase [Leptospiraceae bacterium]
MAFEHKESNFNSSTDHAKIYYQSWTKPNPETAIVIQHGFGEHSGRYGHLLDAIQDQNVSVYGIDSRGHGRSEGKRGHVDQFQHYVDDLAELIHIAKEDSKLDKIVLLGHSLGGVISLQYACEVNNQDHLRGLVVSSPGLKVKMDFEKEVKKFAAEVLSSIMPAMTIDANLDVNFLSHDKSEIEKYQKDPLVHGKISFQMGANLFHLNKAMKTKSHLIKVPILMIHGEADGIADVVGTTRFFEHVESKIKKLVVYPGLYHELMNELPQDREKVLKDISDFIFSLEK